MNNNIKYFEFIKMELRYLKLINIGKELFFIVI
ncbi:hypothetical protein TEGL_01750 [Terrisporobacter glycolicus ATCC 14880 = DSM 1288]|uniref:Uncharacterized protein n=1 Tax=Terrisporobacter glycolicus ATCC 14880 = DSM 1288 TaxID=1121315 RepID=A0ABZ2EQF5_9FIRM